MPAHDRHEFCSGDSTATMVLGKCIGRLGVGLEERKAAVKLQEQRSVVGNVDGTLVEDDLGDETASPRAD